MKVKTSLISDSDSLISDLSSLISDSLKSISDFGDLIMLLRMTEDSEVFQAMVP